MKKIIVIMLITILGSSCATHKIASLSTKGTTRVGGDGKSYKSSVVVHEKTETTGVDAEYKWIRKNYPGATVLGQSLVFHNDKPYDILKIKYKGNTKDVYFDISNYFGKF